MLTEELLDTPFTVTNAGKYGRGEVHVKIGRYNDGSLAILLVTPLGEPEAVASVNMCGSGLPTPPLDHVWLKGWSENKGIPKSLEEAGILKRTGRTTQAGYAKAEYAQLSKELMAFITDAIETDRVETMLRSSLLL